MLGKQGAGPVMAWSPLCVLRVWCPESRDCCTLHKAASLCSFLVSMVAVWWAAAPRLSPLLSSPEPKVSLLSLYFRSACQHLNTRWKRPSPSRQVRTKCAVSAWKWSSRRRLPLRGDLGFSPTAITRTACPASDSGGVPSSSRTQSLSKYSKES